MIADEVNHLRINLIMNMRLPPYHKLFAELTEDGVFNKSDLEIFTKSAQLGQKKLGRNDNICIDSAYTKAYDFLSAEFSKPHITFAVDSETLELFKRGILQQKAQKHSECAAFYKNRMRWGGALEMLTGASLFVVALTDPEPVSKYIIGTLGVCFFSGWLLFFSDRT